MGLPINIDDVLGGRSVEWERLEFKENWNPEAILRTLCAFANDFHNLSGGYIFVGIAEEGGRPILPPTGVAPELLDELQKEVVRLGNFIQPPYFPQIDPCEIGGSARSGGASTTYAMARPPSRQRTTNCMNCSS
jgi:ATP-dependent DNA helicase RecG